jgi:drug/metabolite transporter (DMT)-like permease
MGLAAVVALLFAMGTQGSLTRRQQATAFLLGIPGTGLFFGLWTVAGTEIQPGLVSVFIYTYPLWTLFLSLPLLGEVPRAEKVCAALLGFIGVALSSQLGFIELSVSELGAMIELLLAGFSFALFTVGFKRYFKGEQLLRANAWQLTGALVVLGAWAALSTPVQGIEWSGSLLAVLLWVGVVGTALAEVSFLILVSRYSASSLTAYFFLVVVVALVSSFLIFRETIDGIQGIGVAAIIIAIYLVGRSDRPRGAPHLRREDLQHS